MKTRFDEAIGDLLALQAGLASRSQLIELGMGDVQISRLRKAGRLHRVLPGVYASVPTPLTAEQQLIAVRLYCGQDALVAGSTALQRHGFRYVPDDDQVDVLVRPTCRRRSTGWVRLHRTVRPDESPIEHGLFAICSIPRAIADYARWRRDLPSLRAVTAEAVQAGLCSVAQLRQELADGEVQYRRSLERVVEELEAGVRSAPEAELRDLVCTSAVLPVGSFNHDVHLDGHWLFTPDLWYTDAQLAVEVDSREFHAHPVGWQHTLDRHNSVEQHGIAVIHLTPTRLRRNPQASLRTIENAYQQRIRQRATGGTRTGEPHH